MAWKMIGAAAADLGLRPIDASVLVDERLVDDGLLAERRSRSCRSPLFMCFDRLGDEAVRALARGQAHAVGEVEQEHDVQAIDPARQRGPQQRERTSTTGARRAARAPSGRPRPTAARSAPAALAPPVEQPLQRQQQRRPAITKSGHRSRWIGTGAAASGAARPRRRQRPRRRGSTRRRP